MKRFLAVLISIFLTVNLNAQHWSSQQLVPDVNKTGYSPATGAEFGWSMGASNDWVIVGTLTEKAVIYKQNASTGELMTDTTLDGSAPFIGFGGDVDVSGTTAIVGAKNYGTAGGVFVFEYNTGNQMWEQQQVLEPSDGAANDKFGDKLSIDGDRLIVASKGHNMTGAAYVFKRNAGTWSEFGKYVPSDINNGDSFGTDVAIYGDKMVATSTTHYNGVNGFTGAAWVFEDGGTTLDFVQKLILDATETDFYNEFGRSVEMNNEFVLIGAPDSELSGVDAGAVFAWFWEGSMLMKTNPILPEPAAAGSKFGTSIAIVTAVNKLLVGAPGYNSWAGAMYYGQLLNHVFYQLEAIQSVQPGTAQSFGQSVEVASGKALGGANYGSTNNLTDCGTVEVYGECDYQNINISINWAEPWLESGETGAQEYTWYKIVDNGLFEAPVQIGTGQNQQISANGKYCLKIQKNGCIVLVSVEVTNYVGIDEYSQAYISLSPNPTSDVLQIDMELAKNGLIVLDVVGQEVKKVQSNNSNIFDVSDLDAGVYFLRSFDKQAKVLLTGRFVKSN